MKKLMKLILPMLAIMFLATVVALPAEAAGNVIFVKDNAGSGDGSGSSAENALRPLVADSYGTPGADNQVSTALYQAMKKLVELGGGTIVICGEYEITTADCRTNAGWSNADFKYNEGQRPDVTITYTSVWDGVDYRETAGACIKLSGMAQFAFPSASVTQDLSFVNGTRDNDNPTWIAAGSCPLTLGNGTTFSDTANMKVLGGMRANGPQTAIGTNITIDIGDENEVGDIYGLSNGSSAHNGNSNITIKSGTVVGNIYGDGAIAEQTPINGHVYINIEGGVIKGNIYSLNGGFVNGDGTVNIKITGGNFKDCASIMPNDGELASNPAASVTVDLSGADNVVSYYAQSKIADGIGTNLAADYKEPTAEELAAYDAPAETEEPEVETEEPEVEPVVEPEVEKNNTALIIVIVVVVVAAVAVAAYFFLKKKKDGAAEEASEE